MIESFPYIYKGKSKDAIKQFIKSETGIEISNLLNKYIAKQSWKHTRSIAQNESFDTSWGYLRCNEIRPLAQKVSAKRSN